MFVNSSRYPPRVCRRCYSFELLRISVYIYAHLRRILSLAILRDISFAEAARPCPIFEEVRDVNGSQALVDTGQISDAGTI